MLNRQQTLGFFFLVLVVAAGCNLPPSRNPYPLYRMQRRNLTPSLTTSYHGKPADCHLIRAEFTPVGNNQGRWSGVINGRGPTTLWLQEFEGDRLLSNEYMGTVVLQGRKTPFVYEKSIRTGKPQHWEIKFFKATGSVHDKKWLAP
jgi:hypothetical protein